MDYLKEENYFLEDVRIVFRSYFSNIEDLIIKYRKIDSPEKKNEFLRVVSRYNYLIKDIHYSSSERFGPQIEYVSTTHKFITIIALIESLYKTENYIDFYEWLNKEQKFPLTYENAKQNYEIYKEEYGSRKSVNHFFSYLNDDVKNFIQESITQLNATSQLNTAEDYKSSISDLSNLLYQIRSDFIHNAEVVVEFSDVSTFVRRRKKNYLFKFPLSKLCMVFELGILKYFNIEPEKKPILSLGFGFKQS